MSKLILIKLNEIMERKFRMHSFVKILKNNTASNVISTEASLWRQTCYQILRRLFLKSYSLLN